MIQTVPIMNVMRYALRCVGAAVALLLAACSADGEPAAVPAEGEVFCADLRLAVSEMTMDADTRAIAPISPDDEKYVRTVAIFEFDNEGLHEKRSTSYHFIDFVTGYVDGVKTLDKTDFGVVESTLAGLAFEARSNGMICLVANVTETQVNDFYEEYRDEGESYGRMTFDRFRTWALPFVYKSSPSGSPYDESVSGHVEVMYMFGYYEGVINPAQAGAIAIDLGRLASRLDITIINDTGAPIEQSLGYHFDNVCTSAFFFPIQVSRPPVVDRSLASTIICTGAGNTIVGGEHLPQTFPVDGVHTRYFYVAAHSAAGRYDATQLHIFFGRPVIDDKEMINEDNTVIIPLSNVHGAEADEVPNGYSLSRNTCYRFVIHLKRSAATEPQPATRSAVCEDRPGEYTVYL